MATASTYTEQQGIVREKGILENLMDFSFERFVTPRILKMLFGLHLLAGLIAATWLVFSQFQTSIPNGLLALILSLAGLALWTVYCRVFVELLAAVFHAGVAKGTDL